MDDIYSESILASYATYKELYANDNYRSAYQILAEFIKYILATEEIYSFSIPELKKRIQDVFGFRLPNAVLKSTIKKISYVKRIPNKEEYSVRRQDIKIDNKFSEYKEQAEKESAALTNLLTEYVTEHKKENISKRDLTQGLIAYLLDETNGNRYQEMISAFILENSHNEQVVNQLNAIREGSILYLGLNCNITETGSLKDDLTLYLDMEILFDIYGYNGEVFQSLAKDLISLVNEANRSRKRIKLRYFEDTKREITGFFAAAEDIVRNGTYLKENVAMKAIVNGCKDVTDVYDKESDFYHDLQYKYGILLDDRSDYYSIETYDANLEVADADPAIEQGIKYLSNINKLRKNQVYHEYTQTGYLFVTETGKNLELSNKIAKEQSMEQQGEDDGIVCGLAISMSMLTNILWYKLNRGFGAKDYPQNIDSVIKAKIVLAQFISQNVTATYNRYKREYLEGKISTEQMAGRLIGLREKASKPEDITVENLSDNLNFDPSYLSRYEEERELQRVQLKEKEELIQIITSIKEAEAAEYQSRLNETTKELQKVQSDSASKQKNIEEKEAIIDSQKTELAQKDKLLEKYYERDKKLENRKKVLRLSIRIFFRIVGVCVVTYLSYLFAKHVKADAANTAAIVIGIVSTVLSGIETVNSDIKKIFHEPTTKESE